MLRILVTAFLALQLEDVTAFLRTYKGVTTVFNDGDSLSTENPYVRLRWTPDYGKDNFGREVIRDAPPVYMEFLQDITADLGLKLVLTWYDDFDDVVEGTRYQDFCSTLENKTLQIGPYYPDPVDMLALEDRHCPIEKVSIDQTLYITGTVNLPWYWVHLEEIRFLATCLSRKGLGIRIEGKDSTPEDPDPYIQLDSLAFAFCEKN